MKRATTVSLLLIGTTLTAPVQGQQSNEDLAKQAQNPIADWISGPRDPIGLTQIRGEWIQGIW